MNFFLQYGLPLGLSYLVQRFNNPWWRKRLQAVYHNFTLFPKKIPLGPNPIPPKLSWNIQHPTQGYEPPIEQRMNVIPFRFFRKRFTKRYWWRKAKKRRIWGRPRYRLQRRIRRLARRLYRRTRRKIIYRIRQNKRNAFYRKIRRKQRKYWINRFPTLTLPDRIFVPIVWKYRATRWWSANLGTSNNNDNTVSNDTQKWMDMAPWYILAFSPCNILRTKPFETVAGPDMNTGGNYKHWRKNYSVASPNTWNHVLPLELPQLMSLYNKAKIWGSKWFFKITNFNVDLRERSGIDGWEELRFNDIDMLEIWLWIPDKSVKDPWSYTVNHLDNWAHTVKKTFINIEKGHYAWNDSTSWTSYFSSSAKQKKTAKLSTGYIPNWKIIYDYQSKREYREDDEIDQNIANTSPTYETVGRRTKQPYIYLGLKPINKKGWSKVNTNKLALTWNVFITTKAVFWVEFKDLKEWRQTIYVPGYNTWGDLFPGELFDVNFPGQAQLATASWTV